MLLGLADWDTAYKLLIDAEANQNIAIWYYGLLNPVYTDTATTPNTKPVAGYGGTNAVVTLASSVATAFLEQYTW
jgi:hypothetical protein